MVDKVVSVGIPNCHKILPLVYDESLSYYEAICKYSQKLNEVIELCNSLSDEILAEAKAYTDSKIAETFEEVDAKIRELEQLIETTTENFEQLVEDTVERFDAIVDDLQYQYNQFTAYVNGELTDMDRKIDNVNDRLDDSVVALSNEIDVKIAINNEQLLEEVTENLPSIMKVWNILEGEKVTIQEMFNYLAYLHIVDGIDVQTLANRQLTVSHIAGLQRTVRDCVMYGNSILV